MFTDSKRLSRDTNYVRVDIKTMNLMLGNDFCDGFCPIKIVFFH